MFLDTRLNLCYTALSKLNIILKYSAIKLNSQFVNLTLTVKILSPRTNFVLLHDIKSLLGFKVILDYVFHPGNHPCFLFREFQHFIFTFLNELMILFFET